MTVEEYAFENFVPFYDSSNQLLDSHKDISVDDILAGGSLDFQILERRKTRKIPPIISLARPQDAKEVVKIYQELYDGTYPYKEMLNIEEVKKMIQDSNSEWILFRDPLGDIAGCITFMLDFHNKRGYIRGFMLKKEYQGRIDIIKAFVTSMLVMLSTYRDDILLWYVENRTAHAKSQYSMRVCGVKTIAFYPNKDVFLNKIESDVMQILYNESALREYRSTKLPKIILEAYNCYLYSKKDYELGPVNLVNPNLTLDPILLEEASNGFYSEIVKDKYGYEQISFYIKGTDSYFKFLYTPAVQNFEKTNYKVNNLEELYMFAQKFRECGEARNIRYCEAFISAYEPEHQKIFYKIGLTPRGYIPSWKFNQEKRVLEDHILFNRFEGKINEDIQLLPEGKELLNYLNFNS